MNFSDCTNVMTRYIRKEITKEELKRWCNEHCTNCTECARHCNECVLHQYDGCGWYHIFNE